MLGQLEQPHTGSLDPRVREDAGHTRGNGEFVRPQIARDRDRPPVDDVDRSSWVELAQRPELSHPLTHPSRVGR